MFELKGLFAILQISGSRTFFKISTLRSPKIFSITRGPLFLSINSGLAAKKTSSVADVKYIKQLGWPSGTSVRLGSCRLGFDSESCQTNDFTIGIPSYPA